ncbi:DNA repair rhp54 [Paramyrothecium foliicola]|nr:DNA repair rhp54 [Paramyrothecium foliicola]
MYSTACCLQLARVPSTSRDCVFGSTRLVAPRLGCQQHQSRITLPPQTGFGASGFVFFVPLLDHSSDLHSSVTHFAMSTTVSTPTASIAKKPGRSFPTPESITRLHKPFKCPGVAGRSPAIDRPARKRKRVDYTGADGETDADKPYSNDDRLALATRDANRFPVFQVKDKGIVFRKAFSVPLKDKSTTAYNPNRPPPTLGLRQGAVFSPKPLHDPSGEFAIVLYDPTVDDKPVEPSSSAETKKVEEVPSTKLDAPLMHKSLAEILGIKKKVDDKHPRVPVVLDPRLAKILRPHQVEGVKFMYKCVTGMIDEKANGCIMADEMGLGKTLQCITLLWTLLKQSPDAGKSTIQKAIVVCPASLVKNWANELTKWLGANAINPFAIDGKASKEELTRQLKQWAMASGRSITRPVIIVSYETLRLNVEELKHTQIGLLFCDEGHRLKNGDSNTFSALNNLNVTRRVILTGTPIQNDLTEYFSLTSFANPDLLGSRLEFRKRFEIPILRGRDADASPADRQRGDQCTADLLTVVNKFLIRRTNDILSKYLPVKYEHVVFCNLAPFQLDLYNYFITSPDIKALLRGKGSQPLKAINILKKLCNHPDLLNLSEDLPGSEKCCPEDFVPREARGRDRDVKPWYSGKMQVLDRMLARIRQDTNDKIVLISNYTATLDLFERLCRSRQYGCLRLDGTMTVNKRQKLVDRFNDPAGEEFVFLLSSKAGGCGINLIGANRLVLFDPDWNPAADQQALARVWRDGQKKDCFVYRFIATGTIEEKIFQRQSHKQSLSSCVVDSAEDVERHFSLDSLRELFQYRADTTSDTHDTFKCKRCKPDGKQYIKAPAMLYGDTSTWNHFVNSGLKPIQDLLLRQEAEEPEVSAVFQYISH